MRNWRRGRLRINSNELRKDLAKEVVGGGVNRMLELGESEGREVEDDGLG